MGHPSLFHEVRSNQAWRNPPCDSHAVLDPEIVNVTTCPLVLYSTHKLAVGSISWGQSRESNGSTLNSVGRTILCCCVSRTQFDCGVMMTLFFQCCRCTMLHLVAVGLSIAMFAGANAGVISGPTALDTFPSTFRSTFRLFPGYTGLPGDVCISAKGSDFPGTNTNVIRELNAFVGPYGTDTVDTEFLSMHQVGKVVCGPTPLLGTPLEFKVGSGNGFLPGLGASYGQVWENIGTPVNGKIDSFPANSKFDLFIDVWVDLNTDDSIQFGEVLRNFVAPVIMTNNVFTGFPPWNTSYFLDDTIPVDFFVVNLDGTNSGLLAARMGDCPDCGPPGVPNDVHHVCPEPSSLAIFGGLALLAARRKWKQRREASSLN